LSKTLDPDSESGKYVGIILRKKKRLKGPHEMTTKKNDNNQITNPK
jgi:hypothetical protein